MEQERLDKILAGSGHFTRSEAKSLILAGSVTVDGAVIRRPETKVSRASAITAGGKQIDGAEFVYYMLNKPAGTICATEDGAYPAVTSLLPRHLQKRGLFPVGRLDADVTGLVILTDDGVFAHRVTAPRSEIKKVYEIETDLPLNRADVDRLAAGVTMADGTAYRPAVLSIDPADPRRGSVTVTEGKYHEVKNLISACGKRIAAMKRVSIGGIQLDENLESGTVRKLEKEEALAVFL